MGKREQARDEARFMRGEVGVDGAAVDAAVDPAEAEQAKSREALYQGRTWLGREALCWLLWKSESTEPVCEVEGQGLTVLFGDKLVLRAASGDVVEVAVKGVASPYSALVKQALCQGLLVHGARLRLTFGDRTYEVTIDAEHFDVRAGKLPALLTEEDSEKLAERLELAAQASGLIDALLAAFMAERTGKRWKNTAKALRSWMEVRAA
jgi:hypothetical protein